MCNRDEDNILLKTIANTIPLNDYNPTKDSFWRQVAAEIPGRLPQQCRERYMPAAFWAELTWGFLRISVGRYLTVFCSNVQLSCRTSFSRL